MNGPALIALAKTNQPIVAEVLKTVDQAVQSDPKVLADVFRVVDGSISVLGFAKNHPVLMAHIAGAIAAHPDVIAQFLAAVES